MHCNGIVRMVLFIPLYYTLQVLITQPEQRFPLIERFILASFPKGANTFYSNMRFPGFRIKRPFLQYFVIIDL